MRIWIIAVCLLLLAACSDDAPGRANLVDNPVPESDAAAPVDVSPDAAQPTPAPDALDTLEDCVCSAASACCDGCFAINEGAACDDGLECTLATTCQPDGTCGGATGSPCDAGLTEPQCQSVTCDEVSGCSAVVSAREGFACDDGDPSTYDDKCLGGACVGVQCECSGESACCDGCRIIADDGAACDDGQPETARDTCQQGQCVGEVCECSAGACCDGCHWTPGAVCERFTRLACQDGCGGQVVVEESVYSCVENFDDSSYYCQTVMQPWRVFETRTQCSRLEVCSGGSASARCVSDSSCR